MFRCKQFSIDDNGATMKIGTDAVLLGALAYTNSAHSTDTAHTPAPPRRILDIGTGCGILALMMAQRFDQATIDAIDIDSQTVAVAAANFAMSPWSRRLRAEHISLQDFTLRHTDAQHAPYDLIISNPPYFTNSLKNNDPRRRMARHNDSLSLAQLFDCSAQLTTDGGQLAIILPANDADKAIDEAWPCGLHCTAHTAIINHPCDKPKRSILQLVKKSESTQTEIQNAILALRDEDNSYTDEYKKMTQPFLL